MADVFQRLVGLETEYAILAPADAPQRMPFRYRLYESLVCAVGRRLPTVRAKHFKEGVFTANGGAIWFEAERPSAGGGLIEGATPECRGPREVVTYQRAQDQLLAESAEACQFRLLKNDRDAEGNVYGAQENYEATLGSPFDLLLWRLGLCLLFPLALLTWIAIFVCVSLTMAYFAVATLVYLPLRLVKRWRRSVAMFLFGPDLVEGHDHCLHVPRWLEATLQALTRVLTAPLALSLYLLVRATAFRGIRRKLLPFLVSRPVVCGAGMIDVDGEFHLADKAPALNCAVGFGGMIGDRPIFSMGHFFKAVYAESWFSLGDYLDLFVSRHRLQISLGDSNMCETAEYLRVGTTLLVLDAIDAGFLRNVPRVQRPIATLRQFCADPTLQTKTAVGRETNMTAIDVQRYYAAACRAFLAAQDDPPAEAWDVLRRWHEVLDQLDQLSDYGEVPLGLVGVLDWPTKKYLIDRRSDASWAELKKIDLRYHELSADGYYSALADADYVTSLVDADDVERALRTPPANTPATTRGYFIREFAHGDDPVTANWKSVIVGRGRHSRVTRLANYGKSAGRGSAIDERSSADNSNVEPR